MSGVHLGESAILQIFNKIRKEFQLSSYGILSPSNRGNSVIRVIIRFCEADCRIFASEHLRSIKVGLFSTKSNLRILSFRKLIEK